MKQLSKRALAARLLSLAKRRAGEAGVPFQLSTEQIVVPNYCPVLGLPLKHTAGPMSDDSPTIDRVIPSRGYVPGNIVVISNRANRCKGNATVDEIMRLVGFYQQLAS